MTSEKEGDKRYYVAAKDASALTEVNYGAAITTSAWTVMTGSSVEITPASSHGAVRVVEVDAENKPIAVGDSILNIG